MPILPVVNELGNMPVRYRMQALQNLRDSGVKKPTVAQITGEARKLLQADPLPDPYAGMTDEEREDAMLDNGKYDAAPDHAPKGFRQWN